MDLRHERQPNSLHRHYTGVRVRYGPVHVFSWHSEQRRPSDHLRLDANVELRIRHYPDCVQRVQPFVCLRHSTWNLQCGFSNWRQPREHLRHDAYLGLRYWWRSDAMLCSYERSVRVRYGSGNLYHRHCIG